MPEITILLDNHHLISRYRDAANGVNQSRLNHFMSKLAEIITGKNMVAMRPGPLIFEELSEYITKFALTEQTERPEARVITAALLRTHETQRQHFLNCITPSESEPATIYDRFYRQTLTRGSGKGETLWRQLRSAFPEKCSIEPVMRF